ncbi:hypothetical protein [Saccharopolyspora rosea]|uniref:Uncharacterized protein n=1 Tax=Saccharopolyspora rosea TaxID=524884 RepID=A0ABW3FVJ9_9PSEU|nr:hypothetical protein [Saccharopolyspora rosea]
MSPAAQVALVVIAALVFLLRLTAAIYRARVDGQIAARHARKEQQR